MDNEVLIIAIAKRLIKKFDLDVPEPKNSKECLIVLEKAKKKDHDHSIPRIFWEVNEAFKSSEG